MTWGSGTTESSDSVTIPMNLEVSSPTATATPSRPPDANGWYNHPLSVTWTGSAFSSIASCAPAQDYAGPDSAGAALSGSCTDNAGKLATAGFGLRYDATPPAAGLTADPGDRTVSLSWQASSGPAPLASVQVVRTPGIGGAPASVLSGAAGGGYHDQRVRNGVRYTYTLTAIDQAGNQTVRTVSATPGPRLLTPAPGAHVSRPPLLSWTSVPGAGYYNVQLYHAGKVLSAWPAGARLQLHRSWRYAGRRHRLVRGRYRWYVWPGRGPRSRGRYGPAVGSGTFVVV